MDTRNDPIGYMTRHSSTNTIHYLNPLNIIEHIYCHCGTLSNKPLNWPSETNLKQLGKSDIWVHRNKYLPPLLIKKKQLKPLNPLKLLKPLKQFKSLKPSKKIEKLKGLKVFRFEKTKGP